VSSAALILVCLAQWAAIPQRQRFHLLEKSIRAQQQRFRNLESKSFLIEALLKRADRPRRCSAMSRHSHVFSQAVSGLHFDAFASGIAGPRVGALY
jgi:hypothetical protein